jgi:hypothetical protein
MYIEDWDSFYVQAEELWRSSPLKTRYCIKYRHTEGNLVLKVTDDVVVSPRDVPRRPGSASDRWAEGVVITAGQPPRFLPPPSPAAVPQVQDGSAGGREEDGEAEQPHVPAHVARSERVARCAGCCAALRCCKLHSSAARSLLARHQAQPPPQHIPSSHTPHRCARTPQTTRTCKWRSSSSSSNHSSRQQQRRRRRQQQEEQAGAAAKHAAAARPRGGGKDRVVLTSYRLLLGFKLLPLSHLVITLVTRFWGNEVRLYLGRRGRQRLRSIHRAGEQTCVQHNSWARRRLARRQP